MYTRVESRFWQDEKMRVVSDDARYLMLYFLTSPHRNIVGFYFLPLPYACFDLGWDEKRFMKALQELLSAGLIIYDKQVHVVLVKNYLKHNPLENPNQVKSAIEKLREIPETLLFQDFLEIVKQFDKPLYKPLLEQLYKRLSQPGTGSGTGSGSEIINMCASADAECAIDIPAEKPSDSENTAEDGGAQSAKRKTGKDEYTQEFEEFWAHYQVKSAIEKLREIPETLLFQDFLEIVKQFDKPLYKPLLEQLYKRLSQPGTGSGTGSGSEIINMCASADAECAIDIPAEKPSDSENTAEDGGAQSAKRKTGKDEYTQEFEEFWAHYPRKIEKKSAFRTWKTRIKEGVSAKDMIQAANNYAQYCTQQKTEPRYIKHASTFLGPDKPFSDFIKGVPETEIKPRGEPGKCSIAPQVVNFKQRQYSDEFYKKLTGCP